MYLSNLSQLAVTVLLEVGLHEHEAPVSLAAIQSRLAISTTRLEQVFSKLRQSRLVDSTRGPGGGYCLADASEKISVADIVLAMEDMDATKDIHLDRAQEASVSHRLWVSLNQKILQELQSISLRQLLTAQRTEDAKRSKPSGSVANFCSVNPLESPWWPVPPARLASSACTPE